MKHSQSGDVSQAVQRPKGRRKLQRGQSEDVPYSTRPQVQKQPKKNKLIVILQSFVEICVAFTFLSGSGGA